MRGLLRDTFAELVDRKIIWVFGLLTLFAVLVVGFTSTMEINFQMQSSGGLDELNEAFNNPMLRVFSTFMSFLILLTVFATAGLIPNMFVKGRAEFYLSKPIGRARLFVTRVFSIWIVYGAVVAISGLIVWGSMIAVYDSVTGSVLAILALNLASFFIWLSIASSIGIITGSISVSLISVALVWVAQFLLSYREALEAFVQSKTLIGTVDAMYWILPKTGEISELTTEAGLGITNLDWMPLWTSLAFSIALVLAAAYLFRRKNY